MQVDSDGSGSIEFLEFLLLMGRILKDVPTDADLRDVFTGEYLSIRPSMITLLSNLRIEVVEKCIVLVFDKDRSGFASSSEIKTVMANLGVHFTDEEIQEMMIEVN